MKKARRNILTIIVLLIIASSAVITMVIFTPEPPVAEMEYARKCLGEALKKNADVYSGKLYREASASYDSAMVVWKRENGRFIFFRDYEAVRDYADQTAEKAIVATESSINNTSILKEKAARKIDTLNILVAELNKFFNTYPLESEIRHRISRGKMLLEEAEIDFSKGNFLQANRLLSDSENLILSSYESSHEKLEAYFSSFGQWKKWTDKTIRDSRRTGSNSIIIDKFSRKLYIYQKGVKKMEFNAELGKNWVGDKKVKGDHATPEGMYKVMKKLDSRSTKYHKALLLDYPNAEDIVRFKSDVTKGILPASAKIGGLIEIHGDGGKGIDWTEGCIALTNKEMDIIYRLTAPGTPVTIVGSMIDLREILKR